MGILRALGFLMVPRTKVPLQALSILNTILTLLILSRNEIQVMPPHSK